MAQLTQAQAESERLRWLSAQSSNTDALLVEFVFHGRWVQFDISTLELVHVPSDELWRRYIVPALQAVNVPPAVVADPEPLTEGALTPM